MEPDLRPDEVETERELKILDSLFDKAYKTVLEKYGPNEPGSKFIKDTHYHFVDPEYIKLVKECSELSDEQKQAEINEYEQSVYMGVIPGQQ
jgi:arabinogalactan endo-1,4-beta-galactosidase